MSRRFYNTEIHVDSILLRGPGWEHTLVPTADGMVPVAFHELILPATSAELRTALETRWLSFHAKEPAAS